MYMYIEIESGTTELDELVWNLVSRLEGRTDYVLVSGYISILLGMERPTQDVDILISGFRSREELANFFKEIRGMGWETIPSNLDEVYFLLEERNEKIDIFTDKQWYFDFKKAKTKWGILSLKNPLVVKKRGYKFKIAPPEVQIPYKLWLGSDKDIKDAVYLYERLKDIIDKKAMKDIANEMGVDLQFVLGDLSEN